MNVTYTPVKQRNAISEGFAFGLVLNDRWTLPFNKPLLDLAVAGAFRGWSHAKWFPRVATDLRGLDGVHVLTRADETKHTTHFYWDRSGRELSILRRDETWSAADPDDVDFAAGMISDEVPQQAWQQLAADLLERLER